MTAFEPMIPAAPGRFSTMNCSCQRSPSFCASSRAITSTPPPAATGTMMRTTWSGYSARAASGAASIRPSTSSIRRIARPPWTAHPRQMRRRVQSLGPPCYARAHGEHISADGLQLRAAEHVTRCGGAGARCAGAARILVEPERLDCAGLRARSGKNRDPLLSPTAIPTAMRFACAIASCGRNRARPPTCFIRSASASNDVVLVRAADTAAALRHHARRRRSRHCLQRQLDAQGGATGRTGSFDQGQGHRRAGADARLRNLGKHPGDPETRFRHRCAFSPCTARAAPRLRTPTSTR